MLKTNPFFILNIPMSAPAKTAAQNAEGLTAEGDSYDAEKLKAVFSDTDTRLEAEAGWFPEASDDEEEAIRLAVSTSGPVKTKDLTGAALLNARVYNLGIALEKGRAKNSYDVCRKMIEQIHKIYNNNIDVTEMTSCINAKRRTAGIGPVDRETVAAALSRRWQEISEEIDDMVRKSGVLELRPEPIEARRKEKETKIKNLRSNRNILVLLELGIIFFLYILYEDYLLVGTGMPLIVGTAAAAAVCGVYIHKVNVQRDRLIMESRVNDGRGSREDKGEDPDAD